MTIYTHSHEHTVIRKHSHTRTHTNTHIRTHTNTHTHARAHTYTQLTVTMNYVITAACSFTLWNKGHAIILL